MTKHQLNRCLIILTGSVLISTVFYICYPASQPKTLQKITENNFNSENIIDTIKTYLHDRVLSLSGDAPNLSSYDILGLSPAKRQPQPSMTPVTSDTEECLPYMKDLHIQFVNDHDCDQPHVLMNHGGRLGNKLCQYASVYLLRHLYGVRVSIRKSMKLSLGRVMKNLSLPEQESECFTNNMTKIKYDAMYMKLYRTAKEIRSRAKERSLITEPLLNESYYVYNNPGPRALLIEYRDLVRTILRFKDEVTSLAIKKIDKALEPYNATYYQRDFQIVSVHVRRTDYTGYLKGKFKLKQLDDVYFKGAFDFYKKRLNRPVFLVLSDDMEWCRKTLVGSDVVITDKAAAAVDLATISLADHHITSYGTYSFIGALLGHGHITHPIGHNRRYNLVDCVRSPYFHLVSRDKTYEIDNSHVKLV